MKNEVVVQWATWSGRQAGTGVTSFPEGNLNRKTSEIEGTRRALLLGRGAGMNLELIDVAGGCTPPDGRDIRDDWKEILQVGLESESFVENDAQVFYVIVPGYGVTEESEWLYFVSEGAFFEKYCF
ncbi:hypothetical protein TNCV_4681361 [Trichonephila clavipes]|nr:hypothetical protein TNCV_4681361 [Trichonephila clavipes]